MTPLANKSFICSTVYMSHQHNFGEKFSRTVTSPGSTNLRGRGGGGKSEQSKVPLGSGGPENFSFFKFEGPEYTVSTAFKSLFLEQTASIYSHLQVIASDDLLI